MADTDLIDAVDVGAYRVGTLPDAGYPRLFGVGGRLGELPVQPSPGLRVLVIVERATGTIVGYWPVYNTIHVDGLYLEPDVRDNAALNRVFLGAFVALLQREQVPMVFALMDTPETADMALRLGLIPQRGTLYTGAVPKE